MGEVAGHDAVVEWPVAELNHVAHLGANHVGSEGEAAFAHRHRDDGDSCGETRACEEKCGGREHGEGERRVTNYRSISRLLPSGGFWFRPLRKGERVLGNNNKLRVSGPSRTS